MKVTFTGNYLYQFRDSKTRDKAYKCLHIDMNHHDFDVYKVKDDKMLLLNGQDYKDYLQAVRLNRYINIEGVLFETSFINGLAKKSVPVDLSDIDYSPKHVLQALSSVGIAQD